MAHNNNEEQLIPTVGMAATKHYYSDSQGAKVLAVLSPKKIVVGYFKYPGWGDDEQIDVNKAQISNDYEAEVWSLRKSGSWRLQGDPDKWGYCSLHLGRAYSYRSLYD